MVYKVSKGGVRSGNTLRGLRSLRSKRYSRHACLIGSSSLNHKDVTTLIESKTEDKLISETLGSTDVILSLNKKQRWRLPATVSHMIKNGSFNHEKTMVSIPVRHKLKRRANCVSFACNKGRVRIVTPKDKRYFSFTSENIDEEKSKRQMRRDLAEERKKMKPQKVKKNRRTDLKTMYVYTKSGKEAAKRSSGSLPSNKPEYRLEVFYPCPSSCSLAFNPKYTDVVLEQNNEGHMQVRANHKADNKSQGHHRKRYTAKDIDALSSDIVYDDVENVWRDQSNSFDLNVRVLENEELTSENSEALINGNKEPDVVSKTDNIKVSEYNLASLISQAEQAQQFCGNNKLQRRRKISNNQKLTSTAICEKSHIIYVDRNEPEQPRAPKTEIKSNKQEDYPALSSARVILSTDDTQSMALKTKLGILYAEAESEPRRFAINITDDIRNLLGLSQSSSDNPMYTSYLVFIHDGFYDEGYDIFRVIFNSNLCKDTSSIVHEISFQKSSIEGIMNCIAECLLSLKELNLLDLKQNTMYIGKENHIYRFVNERMKVTVESFHTSDEFCRVANTETIQEKTDFSTQLNKVMEDFDLDLFCEICYENINPTQFDARPGTRLTKCGHLFCDECWKSHFDTQTKDGAVQMMCPGYQCDSTVGLITLLSLVHVTQVGKLVQRSVEEKLETCPEVKWCPNPKCGRVIRLDRAKKREELSLDVACPCGQEMCFSCLSPPHWPAKCEQAETYMDQLSDIKPINEVSEDPTTNIPIVVPPKPKKTQVYEVVGRMCPRCSKFIEKNGGCPNVICRCGFQFCWTCLESSASHNSAPCKPIPSVVYEHTRRVKVYHIDVTPSQTDQPEVAKQKPVLVRSRQKATMYQRALRQRMEIPNKKKVKKEIDELALSMAKKTSEMKREILMEILVDSQNIPSDEGSLQNMSIVPHLTQFLASMDDLKRALHHVAEFTFVLLQDAPTSIDKRKAFKLATDLSSYGSFIRSIQEAGSAQDPRTIIKRLLDIQIWARRALDTLLSTVRQLRR